MTYQQQSMYNYNYNNYPYGTPSYPIPPNTSVPPPTTASSIEAAATVNNISKREPITTVFVGEISERAPDAMIKEMLQRCGNVISWKRVQGATSKLQAFGFCEYEDPESTLRCIRLLNDILIADKRLVVKVDLKTKQLLDAYKIRKKEIESSVPQNVAFSRKQAKEEVKEEGEADDDEVELDPETRREDDIARAGIAAILKQYDYELKRKPPEESKEEKKEPEPIPGVVSAPPAYYFKDDDKSLENSDIPVDERDKLKKEIANFRQKAQENQRDDGRRERSRERDRGRQSQDRYKDERNRRDRSMRSRSPRYGGAHPASRTARSNSRNRSRTKSPEVDRYEEFEKQRLERKIREKEIAYQDRLKLWESRERKRAREYEKFLEKDNNKKREEVKEAKRLREFLEDYDDEKDDQKYYKSAALNRRLKDREREMEMDARDRQREKDEIEEIKRKLVADGYSEEDIEAKMEEIEKERDEHLLPRLDPKLLEPGAVIKPLSAPETMILNELQKPLKARFPSKDKHENNQYSAESNGTPNPELSRIKSTSSFVLDSKSPAQMKKQIASPIEKPVIPIKPSVREIFNDDEEEERIRNQKMKKLVPLEYTAQEELALNDGPRTMEEKRQYIKELIEQIPTQREELFNYKIDWDIVDESLMEKRIKPWVNKKIVEYIGEEEHTLKEFICNKVMTKTNAKDILTDIAPVLDDEAEVFVVKMWRLLIYETEAKKAGLDLFK